jgi:hypothetical protein
MKNKVLHRDKMSHHVKRNKKKTSGQNVTKGQRQETGRKYVIDEPNVTNQVTEGGHDVTSDNISTLMQGDVKSHDVLNGSQNVAGSKCHSGINVQRIFHLSLNVQ